MYHYAKMLSFAITRCSMIYVTGIIKLFDALRNPLAGPYSALAGRGQLTLQKRLLALYGSGAGSAGPIYGMCRVAHHTPRSWRPVNESLA